MPGPTERDGPSPVPISTWTVLPNSDDVRMVEESLSPQGLGTLPCLTGPIDMTACHAHSLPHQTEPGNEVSLRRAEFRGKKLKHTHASLRSRAAHCCFLENPIKKTPLLNTRPGLPITRGKVQSPHQERGHHRATCCFPPPGRRWSPPLSVHSVFWTQWPLLCAWTYLSPPCPQHLLFPPLGILFPRPPRAGSSCPSESAQAPPPERGLPQ